MMLLIMLASMAGFAQALPVSPSTPAAAQVDLSAAVSVDVQFDEGGKPKSCRILQSSGSIEQDKMTCANIMAGQAQMTRLPSPDLAVRPSSGVETKLILMPASGPVTPSVSLLNIGEVFSTDDYPVEAIRKEEEGLTVASVTVDSSGRPTACAIAESSGSPSLDSTSCALLVTRGKFAVPRDAKGSAVARTGSVRVRWVLPESPGLLFADSVFKTIFSLDQNGKISACRYESEDSWAADRNACDSLRAIADDVVERDLGSVPAANREMVLEDGILVGARESASAVGTSDGSHLVRRQSMAMTIDADGAVVDCKLVEPTGMDTTELDRRCGWLKAMKFEPLAPDAADRSPRYAVAYMALYLRR